MKLDNFIEEVLTHPNAADTSGNNESSELLDKDSETADALNKIERITDLKLKRTYGYLIVGILCCWIVFVGTFTFFQLYVDRPVSETVLVTLLTTTTANIIALPIIILKYLFQSKK